MPDNEDTKPTPKLKPRLMTIEQACVYAARSPSTIKRRIVEGKIKTIKDGRSTLVVVASVDAWIQEMIEEQEAVLASGMSADAQRRRSPRQKQSGVVDKRVAQPLDLAKLEKLASVALEKFGIKAKPIITFLPPKGTGRSVSRPTASYEETRQLQHITSPATVPTVSSRAGRPPAGAKLLRAGQPWRAISAWVWMALDGS